MGGGLMQLVAYGAQDIYLTGNPQITFFKVVYRRHTNFSMEAIEQTWSGTSTGGDGRCTATISRNGDLVHKMYLEVTTADNWTVPNPGSSLITSVELEIGGQQIDKHYGHWMETWAELTQSNNTGLVAKADGALNTTEFQRLSGMGGVEDTATAFDRLYIPLQFWFCRNPGLSLPLIALQYHEVKVVLDHVIDTVSLGAQTNSLWCDYIYLDTDERRRFAQVSHEYLIEQVQHQSFGDTDKNKSLNFNHPVKELIWTGGYTQTTGVQLETDITSAGNFQLKLNGHDRFAARDFKYFSRCQVFDYHTGSGSVSVSLAAAGVPSWDDAICVYSFALKPEEHQPSGTCNFSRIDTAQLTMSSTGANLEVYAINYNVLRIMSGMGGLAYSN